MIFTAEDIQARLRIRPFPPMRVMTTTGETYDIYHPDMVLPARRFLEIGVPSPDDSPTVPDQIARVALVHIVSLTDLPAAVQPASANGD